ncbi:uncharacterized protein LOC135093011 [Scylla paramamosain]|uniref:uncharacterized protein LOC135093011 n=1 Tax=Scylla paramamosain TaxID=85552 RepID=UPI0030839B75
MMDAVLRNRDEKEERREINREEMEEVKEEEKYSDTFEDTDDENPPDEGEGGGGGEEEGGGEGGGGGGSDSYEINEKIRKICNEREIEREEELHREGGGEGGRGRGLRHRCFMNHCRERQGGGSHREERGRGGGGGGGGMREEGEEEEEERKHIRIYSESGVEAVTVDERVTKNENNEGTRIRRTDDYNFILRPPHSIHQPVPLPPLPLLTIPPSNPYPYIHPYQYHPLPYQYPQCPMNPHWTYTQPRHAVTIGGNSAKPKQYASFTKDYITGLAFLARVDRVARVMVNRSMSIVELRQCASPALCLLLLPQKREGVEEIEEDKSLQDLHSLQQTISLCSGAGRGTVTQELRNYCRSLVLAVLCPGRHHQGALLVENGVQELERRAFHDHGPSQVKYCWSFASSLCIILERLGWVPSAQ